MSWWYERLLINTAVELPEEVTDGVGRRITLRPEGVTSPAANVADAMAEMSGFVGSWQASSSLEEAEP